jgi:hypothetical protein
MVLVMPVVGREDLLVLREPQCDPLVLYLSVKG